MSFKILVVSPDRSLGEQISEKLREANLSALLASSAAEAAFIVQGEKCTIAVLDCQLPDPGTDYLAENLRAYFHDIRIIFIHAEERHTEPIKINQDQDVYLPSPFFIPDLLEVINIWVAEKKSKKNNELSSYKTREIPSSLTWLQDVNKAAQYLTRLSLEIDAQVALIVRDDKIWAYAGQLSKLATEELAQFVGHHWANSDGSDLARFVRLVTTDCEYMLYATHLGSGFVLTLCFMPEMPFTKIRAQTAELARKLTGSSIESTRNYLQTHQQNAMVTENGEMEMPPFENETSQQKSSLLSEDTSGRLDNLGSASMQEIHPITQNHVQLESESFDRHDLAYSCILLPRMPDHNLTGGLIDLLKSEISRLCLAFGWRLKQLNIEPTFLYWVVDVTPDVAASTVIRHIREQTSAVLFAESSRFTKENPSGDFWAPGFLVISGRQTLSESMVQKFIQNTRDRQGINQDYNKDNNA